jgi:5'-3' exonuclease
VSDEINVEDQAKYQMYSKHINSDLKYMFLDYLNFRKFDFIVAPYESDAQLAFMFHKKEIDVIVTEDSDLIAYNCTKIIKGVKFNGDCQYLDLTKRIIGTQNDHLRTFVNLSILNRPREKGLGVHSLRL